MTDENEAPILEEPVVRVAVSADGYRRRLPDKRRPWQNATGLIYPDWKGSRVRETERKGEIGK